jgi:hypothetical protein
MNVALSEPQWRIFKVVVPEATPPIALISLGTRRSKAPITYLFGPQLFPFLPAHILGLGKGKGKGTVHPCTGTVALYRPYGPWGE